MMFDFIEDPDLRKQAEDAHKATLETAVSTAIDKELSGLKGKNEDLLKEAKEAKKLLKKFEGLDIDAAKEAMSFLEKNDKARLIKEGKFEDLIDKETSKIRTTFEEQIETLETTNKGLVGERDTFRTKYESKVIEDGLRAAALNAGVLPHALEDVIYRGRKVFALGKDESLEARDADGKLVKVDDLVLTPKLFVEGLKDVAPHYWPGSTGLGAGDEGSSDDFLVAMEKAADRGDMKEFKRLRALRLKKMSGK